MSFLFLPAAGDFRSGTSWYSGVAIHSTQFGKVARFTHNECYAPREWPFERVSVRLASVVSEGLTQTRKCHIVFGIDCPVCHSERSEESISALLVQLPSSVPSCCGV